MSDRKTSVTPIIVGAVIALLGILIGLYIATNAREQLEAQNPENASAATESLEQTADEGLPTAEQAALPELPAVDDTPESVEPDVASEDPELPEVPEVPEVTTVEPEQSEPDDFVPVSPDEMEQVLPQQQDTI